MEALHKRDVTEADTARGMGEGEAKATRRVCTRGGMRSMEVMPAEEVSQRETEATSMSPLAFELAVIKAMMTPRRKTEAPGCSAGTAAATVPKAT